MIEYLPLDDLYLYPYCEDKFIEYRIMYRRNMTDDFDTRYKIDSQRHEELIAINHNMDLVVIETLMRMGPRFDERRIISTEIIVGSKNYYVDPFLCLQKLENVLKIYQKNRRILLEESTSEEHLLLCEIKPTYSIEELSKLENYINQTPLFAGIKSSDIENLGNMRVKQMHTQ